MKGGTFFLSAAITASILLGNALNAQSDGGDDPKILTVVSDSTWQLSTVFEPSSTSGYWRGVSYLPSVSSFTLPVVIGEPYPFNSIDSVDGSRPIRADNNIHFYRKTFHNNDSLAKDIRFRTLADDGLEIYLNRELIARIGTINTGNQRLPCHDMLLDAKGSHANGNDGGDLYQFITSKDLNTILKQGTNELIIVSWNLSFQNDKGGFTFRMDVADSLEAVGGINNVSLTEESSAGRLAEIFPNPATQHITIQLADGEKGEVQLLDAAGRSVARQNLNGGPNLINLQDRPAGLYLARIKVGDQLQTTRLLKR